MVETHSQTTQETIANAENQGLAHSRELDKGKPFCVHDPPNFHIRGITRR